ncbi:hypothetical protein ACQR0Z_18305 [Bradyrhizobium sp. HKCCYLS3077]|uniref:hypothetical protein n=1 Tax=Bradyrhizobium sp. HKCCYLS3077 TaxID=3420761 RepID=UPI003EBC1290
MSRFDELTKLFNPWRKTWVEQYRAHQTLPFRIAKHIQHFLGCPEYFGDPTPNSGQRHRYVSPTHATWNNEKLFFNLEAHDDVYADVEFHEDGFFYFGLRVFLEHAPRTYPKEAFWLLYRSRFDGSRFFVTEQSSKKEFDIGFDPLILDPLSENLFERLKADLNKSPMVASDFDNPRKIGFF